EDTGRARKHRRALPARLDNGGDQGRRARGRRRGGHLRDLLDPHHRRRHGERGLRPGRPEGSGRRLPGLFAGARRGLRARRGQQRLPLSHKPLRPIPDPARPGRPAGPRPLAGHLPRRVRRPPPEDRARRGVV
ncbi:MAG: UPF0047 protein Bsu YugU, partial [uncultured Rubrobacteraceae bacterium]